MSQNADPDFMTKGGSLWRAAELPKLMFYCPVTGYVVPTGVCMNAKTFASLEIEGGIVACPHCGNNHNWDKKDIIIPLDDDTSGRR